MPRANRFFLPGQIWHITHRCHRKSFLLRFARDRRGYLSWLLEPISYVGTCATEARWDAGRGGEPEAICRYCEGSRQRDAPRSPRPLRDCGQDGRLLRYPPRQYRHIAFVGRLAYGPSWPQRITRLVMKQVLSRAALAALVPHRGSMCLLEEVQSADDDAII